MRRHRRLALVGFLGASLGIVFSAQTADAQPKLPFKTKPAATTQPSTQAADVAPAPAAPRSKLPFGRPGAKTQAAAQPTSRPVAPSAPRKVDEPRLLPPSDDDLQPLGYAGPRRSTTAGSSNTKSRAAPLESNFLPISDRWRIGLPPDYAQNTRGSILDPYDQNVLTGDYPAFGTQDIFVNLSLTSDTLLEARRTPVPSGVSTLRPGKFEFFGDGDSFLAVENLILSAEVFKGDASYRPKDWAFRATAVGNQNYVHAEELGVTKPDVRDGRDRTDSHLAMQELFGEMKIADLSTNFDFVSVRAGIQGFTSDFRGFLFSDNEPGVRLFGNYDNNRLQYNLAWFHQLEKDTNSGLNTFNSRDQDIFIANAYRQDFIWPGYTAQLSIHANIDRGGGGLQYDRNGFLVRPAPVGTIREKEVNAVYLGWAGDGHIGRFNISHQFYQALGTESFNPLADRAVNINAQMAALELSYDFDWIRYRGSFLYLSGDGNPQDGTATGFDTIFDNPNFAGGGFSYFTRQAIRLTGSGVGLVGRNSFTPSLRTSKEQGQANFVNPGLFLYNVGADMDLTPKVKLITNASYLQFADTSSLQLILQDDKIGREIGFDLSAGLEYRPLLNNNVIFTVGAAALVPGQGFRDLYTSQTLYSTFVSMTVSY